MSKRIGLLRINSGEGGMERQGAQFPLHRDLVWKGKRIKKQIPKRVETRRKEKKGRESLFA